MNFSRKLMDHYRTLLDRFGPQHWWPGETPLEIMVGAVLTQNTNWANVERAIADSIGARLEGHAFPIINGVQFDVKHKIGSSSVPHGRHTPLSKAIIWNQLHSEIAEDQPNADIILRGHVHYHIGVSCVAKRRIVHAWTCPALQGLGSEYGDRECEGTVDYGLMHFDINDDGSWSQQTHLLFAESHKAQSTVCCV